MRRLTLLAAATFAATAVPASATITFGNQTVSQGEEVLLNSGATGTTVTGSTNQTHTSVTFTSGPTTTCPSCVVQTLSEPSNGQARIETSDGSVLQSLTINLTNTTDPLFGIGYIEFNLSETANLGNAINVIITGIDQMGTSFSTPTTLVGSGSNFFSALASGGEVIRSISFDAGGTTGFTDIRQIRITPAVGGEVTTPLPEPGTWAMMLLGFGAAGVSLRRSRRRNALLTQIA
jgi:PEP-CTERM motif-containing protein